MQNEFFRVADIEKIGDVWRISWHNYGGGRRQVDVHEGIANDTYMRNLRQSFRDGEFLMIAPANLSFYMAVIIE